MGFMGLQSAQGSSSVNGYYSRLGSYIKDSGQSPSSQPPPRLVQEDTTVKAEVASKAGNVVKSQEGKLSGQGILLDQQG